MSYEHISALLDKYWEGESTLEEERMLKAYFASGQVDEQFRLVAPLFQALHTEQGVQYTKTQTAELRPQTYQWRGWAVAASLAVLLIAGSWWYLSSISRFQDVVDEPAAPNFIQEKPVSLVPEVEAPVATVDEVKPLKLNEKPKRKSLKKTPPRKSKDSFEDPEMAYEEIKAALALVSSKLNKGKNEAAKNINKVDNIDKFFKKKKDIQG